MVTIVLMLVAGFSTLTWVAFINDAGVSARRDRDRMTAFYAAEGGVEIVVDYFNNPDNFLGQDPPGYDEEATHPSTIQLRHNVAPAKYKLFEPYIVSYALDTEDRPVYDANGELVVQSWTYYRNRNVSDDVTASLSSKIPTGDLDISREKALVFRDESDKELARITRIRLIHPADLQAAGELPEGRTITKVESTAVTPNGVEVTVEAFLQENPVLDLRSPGAIITLNSATFSGDYGAHWGDVWAQEDLLLPSNWEQKIPVYVADGGWVSKGNTNQDEWLNVRTEGQILDNKGTEYADGREDDGFAATPIPSSADNYFIPFHPDVIPKKSNIEGYLNIKQHQNLEFPMYDYEEWKAFVKENQFGYFYTGIDGTIYGTDTATGAIIGKDFDEWFNISPSDSDYDNLDQMIVFIDSVPVDDNGNPGPSENGIPVINATYYPRNPQLDGVMATIKQAGTGLHSRGVMFIAANVDMGGQGNAPSWTQIPDSVGGVLLPDGSEPPSGSNIDIFHYGFLYAWGTIANGGNRTIYGSVYTELGYTGNGTPDVYYNYRLRDGSWLDLNNSRVARNLWNIKPNS